MQLALEIANEQAASIIECNGVSVCSKNGALLWYEVDPNDDYCGFEVQRALRYLNLRGVLRVRRSNPNHVKAVTR